MPKFRQYSWCRAPGSKSKDSINSGRTIPVCRSCGKNHKGEGIANKDASFGFGKSGHQIRKCPAAGQKGKDFCQVGQYSLSIALVG